MFKLTYEHLPLINSMNEAAQYILAGEDKTEMVAVAKDLKDAFISLGFAADNSMVHMLDELNSQEFKNAFEQQFTAFYKTSLIAITNSFKTSSDFTQGIYGCDRQFSENMKFIEARDEKELYTYAMSNLALIQQNNPSFYNLITEQSKGWYFEDNWLDGVGGDNNSLVYNRVSTLKRNVDKIKELYDVLQDNRSKDTLNAIISSWLTFSIDDICRVGDNDIEVFDTNVFPYIQNEVMVDCGSYIGDTVEEYIAKFGVNYKRIYTYDISAPTVKLLKKALMRYDNIIANVKGVGEKKDVLHLQGYIDAPFACNHLVDKGDDVSKDVEVVKLDDDIKEPISFLKVDVEGLDKQALLGAQMHIINDHPRIQVDTYHRLVDFFEVPILINRISPTYSFYLRAGGYWRNNGELRFAHTSIYAQ